MIKTVDQEVARTQVRLNPIAYAIKSHIHSRPSQILAAALLSGSLAMPLTASAQNVLEEIIVTAQKRTENLQDVPISVTALSATKLEQLGISDFHEYIAMMPSVSFKEFGPGLATIYMRGASDGGDGNASGSQPSVGLYLDEAPVTAISANIDIHIYDIERIEALAGPQGTLYGGSNQSGTLRIITNKPDTEKFSAGFDVGGFGTKDGEGSYSIEGFANIPLNDKAAIRLVAWNIEEGGWIDNVAGERTYLLKDLVTTATLDNASLVEDDFNDITRRGLRAALKVELSESWVANVGLLYQKQKTEGTFFHDPGPANPRSDTIYARFDPGGTRNIGLHTPAGERKIQRFNRDFSDEDFFMGSWTLEGEVANHNLIYAGAYYDRDVQYQSDYSAYGVYQYFVPYYACDYSYDCTTLNEIQTRDDNYQRQTHEVRLSSLAEGRLHYTLGGYFTEVTHKYLQQWHQPGMSDALEVGGEDGIYFRTDQERTNQETAVFGDLTYDLTDAFSVSGGFRYFWNDSELAGVVGWGPGNFAVRDTPVD
ncbi:MAG: TonB-dependent receptor, partial [Proteobacteria bacterium]|nr:TonB-dependent receptor [Pseudomonadota bacterium]